ncbi:septum formation family protein [Arthrobacter sp. H14-L1]|uniref:septum formation family protein n=1 Tax=Arthrobacter sp. H14-L1 TaxID=2996697 RepID=UPI00226E49B0|nr:septum formation family protein [Arthrobacter sp. H14-L1]MCY0905560.1 septum formation family protein [Arthrobacter sp. H14-L1]
MNERDKDQTGAGQEQPRPDSVEAQTAARLSPTEPNKPAFTPVEPASTSNRRLYVIIGAAVVAVLVIIALIWLLVALISGGKETSTGAGTPSVASAAASKTVLASGTPQPTPSATPSASAVSTASPGGTGLITSDAPPTKWAKGDCFRAFKDASQNADIVDCATPHAAQLVATYSYPEAGNYPGLDALKAKAADTCSSVKLSSAANNYTYKPKSGYPSQTTWAKGDRRVDCIIVDDSGDNIRESLLS